MQEPCLAPAMKRAVWWDSRQDNHDRPQATACFARLRGAESNLNRCPTSGCATLAGGWREGASSRLLRVQVADSNEIHSSSDWESLGAAYPLPTRLMQRGCTRHTIYAFLAMAQRTQRQQLLQQITRVPICLGFGFSPQGWVRVGSLSPNLLRPVL